jgi:hypothetical protein
LQFDVYRVAHTTSRGWRSSSSTSQSVTTRERLLHQLGALRCIARPCRHRSRSALGARCR